MLLAISAARPSASSRLAQSYTLMPLSLAERVQRREPILAGVDATLEADAGAIRALGETARATLVEARDALRRELDGLRVQAAS